VPINRYIDIKWRVLRAVLVIIVLSITEYYGLRELSWDVPSQTISGLIVEYQNRNSTVIDDTTRDRLNSFVVIDSLLIIWAICYIVIPVEWMNRR
jgi:hypothetical protein